MICDMCFKDVGLLVPRNRNDIGFGLVCLKCDKEYDEEKLKYYEKREKASQEIIKLLNKTNNNLDYDTDDIKSILGKFLPFRHSNTKTLKRQKQRVKEKQ